MRTSLGLVFVAAAASLAGCGVSNPHGNTGTQGGGVDLASSFVPGADMAGPACPNPGPDGCPVDTCSEQAKLVYVVDENNKLSSFKPDTLQFSDIGTMNCPAMFGATPFSMAVDRNAVAWVLYSSGEVFKVDTATAKCTSTGFSPNQQGFEVFGMGFSTTMAGGTDETLFIAGGSSANIGASQSLLGTLDTKTLRVSKVGNVAGSPELTGTSDATLWGFFPDATMPRVAGIDKKSGALSHVYPLSPLAGMPAAWAFAFWGGDFWIFLQRSTDASTKVWHLKSGTGQVGAAIQDTGRKIVGAGVSTCAPVMIGRTEGPTPPPSTDVPPLPLP